MGFRRAAHVAWRRVGDETVLIHLRNKKIYVLNPSGGFFWHSLDGARTAEEMLEGVTLTLEEPMAENATSGLEDFLKRLLEAGLVEVEGGAPLDPAAGAAPSVEYPLPSFVPPELVWQEELRNFGQSCAFLSGESAACNDVPTM
jgi:hypothetical protein